MTDSVSDLDVLASARIRSRYIQCPLTMGYDWLKGHLNERLKHRLLQYDVGWLHMARGVTSGPDIRAVADAAREPWAQVAIVSGGNARRRGPASQSHHRQRARLLTVWLIP